MPLFWTLALKKKWGISAKLVHLVQLVEWQGRFITSQWTWSQKYVFHWPGRSGEVLWLRLEQSGHSSDPHGLMTENLVRVSLSRWLTLCTTSHPLQNLSNIENTFHGPWNLCSILRTGWRRTRQIFLSTGCARDCTCLSHRPHLVAIYTNSQPCHQEKITFWV